MLRRSLVLVLAIAAAFPAAAADDSKITAGFAPLPKATIEPPPDLGPNTLDCPPAICGLQLPNDLWKRDALKKQPEAYLNAATVVIDRGRRQALDQSFTETPLMETKLGDSSCLGSLMMTKDFEDKTIMKFLHCGF